MDFLCLFTIKQFIYCTEVVFKQQFQSSSDGTSQSVYGQNIPLSILNTCCHFDLSKMDGSAKIIKIMSLHFILRLGCKPRCGGQTCLTAAVKLYTAHACNTSHTLYGGQELQLKQHQFLINLLLQFSWQLGYLCETFLGMNILYI